MLTKNTDEVLNRLKETTDLFIKDIKDFIDSFDTDELFTFSDSEAKRKNTLRLYNSFSIKLNKHIKNYENSVLVLSQLICNADKNCDAPLTKKLSNEFERYTQLFKFIKKFITSCEFSLLNKDKAFKQSTIISTARDLLSAVIHYKDNF